MILKRNPNSRIMKMEIQHEWLDFRTLFLMHDHLGEDVHFSTNVITFRESIDDKDVANKLLCNAIMDYSQMHFIDSWDNIEVFIDRESVKKRIAELAKQSNDSTALVLRTILEMYGEKLQSRKDFFGKRGKA